MRARPPEHANRSTLVADRGIHERGSGHGRSPPRGGSPHERHGDPGASDRARARRRGDPANGPQARRPARRGRRARSPRSRPGVDPRRARRPRRCSVRSVRDVPVGGGRPRGRDRRDRRGEPAGCPRKTPAPARRPGRGAAVECLELRRHDPRQARRGPRALVLGGHAGRRDRLRAPARRADRARLRRDGDPRTSLADRGQRRPNGAPRRRDACALVRRPRRDARRPDDVPGRGPRGTGVPGSGRRRRGLDRTPRGRRGLHDPRRAHVAGPAVVRAQHALARGREGQVHRDGATSLAGVGVRTLLPPP